MNQIAIKFLSKNLNKKKSNKTQRLYMPTKWFLINFNNKIGISMCILKINEYNFDPNI